MPQGSFFKLGDQGECHQWWYTSKKSCWISIVILLFPGSLRILQNLRQLYDTGKHHPCITNTFKYVLGLLVSMFGLMHQVPSMQGGHDWHFYVYLIPFISATLYSFFWDIFMDWNLFPSNRTCLCFPCGKTGLRKERLYGRPWIYQLALVADFLLRFFGTMTFVPKASNLIPSHSTTLTWLSYLAPVLEVFRRTLWSIFKVENMELGDMVSCAKHATPAPLDAKGKDSLAIPKFAIKILAVIGFICAAAGIIAVTGNSSG